MHSITTARENRTMVSTLAARFFLFAATLALVGELPGGSGPRAPAPVSHADSVLFFSRFEDDDVAGWRFDRRGVWSLEHGRLHAALPKERQEKSFAFTGADDWTD